MKRTQTASVKLVPLAQLKAHPRNPRRHDRGEIDALKASMLEYGFTEPLIRQVKTGYIVAGAGRLQAAGELAEEGKLNAVEFTPGVRLNGCLPVVDKALTDRQALAYCIADNRITERGTWDFPLVKDILVTDLGLTADVASFDLPVGFEPHILSSIAFGNDPDAAGEWKGMPEYVSEEIRGSAFVCLVRCKTEDDLRAFEKFLGWKLPHKGKVFSTWYPQTDFDQLGRGKGYTTES